MRALMLFLGCMAGASLLGCGMHRTRVEESDGLEAIALVTDGTIPCDSLSQVVATAAHLPPAAGALVRESLRRHEGTVVRWPTPRSPLAVWLQPYWRPATAHREDAAGFMDAVRHAVRGWDRAEAGLRLRLTGDSATADVRVLWTDRLDPRAETPTRRVDGRSAVYRSAATGAVEHADVYLGDLDERGATRRPADVHAMAVHEIGHVLGLSHATASSAAPSASVMAARVVADEVTTDDHRALRAWYALPVGLRCYEEGKQ